MKYFNEVTGRFMDSEELVKMYGTNKEIPELGIYPLTYQPDFYPLALNKLANDTFLPIEGNLQVEVQNMVKAGFTEAEATALLTE